jgi:hypothetical protein
MTVAISDDAYRVLARCGDREQRGPREEAGVWLEHLARVRAGRGAAPDPSAPGPLVLVVPLTPGDAEREGAGTDRLLAAIEEWLRWQRVRLAAGPAGEASAEE